MSTYRERREARADRLDDWADKRAAKATAESDSARARADMIPFGQPILIGHHSERRDRNYRARISAGFDRAHENASKASDMASRAENIRAQAAQAIYSDDPDATDRLAEKVERLEAKRDAMKAANTAYRREHKAELKAMTPYGRNQALPFPSWSLTNLGATIRNARKRAEQIERAAAHPPADRVITARYGGKCADCGATLDKGQTIRYSRAAGARCAEQCE